MSGTCLPLLGGTRRCLLAAAGHGRAPTPRGAEVEAEVEAAGVVSQAGGTLGGFVSSARGDFIGPSPPSSRGFVQEAKSTRRQCGLLGQDIWPFF
jgi:hypothetical protein